MVPNLLSYTHSIFNPLLKWIVLLLFVIATYFFIVAALCTEENCTL